ncbi:MAG TPA: DNA-3-methyladenine glycosylase I [Ferruginibacter sp.]|nr:DNA-3-methyladenine glycosylase I [Ferruginibacter sp.]HMP19757.1 DNA-3-methyladenine glycosylase I [Ferruginibacter sp.]
MTTEKKRCPWCLKDDLYKNYHDTEWGTPLHNDQQLFELLCLEGAQAGLSWHTVLKKRENYRKAFDNFNAIKMSKYTAAKIEKLLQDEGIIRNRLKVHAFVGNAKAFLKLQQEFGSFDTYIWQFVGGRSIINKVGSMGDVPAKTAISDAMSKDLLKRGFKFVGSTICYAFMQASGMVDDHLDSCWKKNSKKRNSGSK